MVSLLLLLAWKPRRGGGGGGRAPAESPAAGPGGGRAAEDAAGMPGAPTAGDKDEDVEEGGVNTPEDASIHMIASVAREPAHAPALHHTHA